LHGDPLALHSFPTRRSSDLDTLEDLLRKFFNYVPQLRADCLRPLWHSHEKDDASWVEVYQSYTPAPGGYRILLNGRNVAFADGFGARVGPEDGISLFPPGRSQTRRDRERQGGDDPR